MDIKQAVTMAKNGLSNFENPLLEAEWLVALTLKKKRPEIYGNYDLTRQEERRLQKNIKRRAQGWPLEYLVGSANFYGYDLKVNRNTLIPRPETEELAEMVIKNAKSTDKILDIGTGSGAIAIAIKNKTGASVVAVDISPKALKVAKKNAIKNGAAIEFIKSNLFSKLQGRRFDKIVSNPPYVSESEYRQLERGVRDFEPKLALVAKEDGLHFYKKIIADAPKHLEKGGKIYFEIGYNQAKEIAKLLDKDFKDIVIKKDLEGQDRIVCATIKGEN